MQMGKRRRALAWMSIPLLPFLAALFRLASSERWYEKASIRSNSCGKFNQIDAFKVQTKQTNLEEEIAPATRRSPSGSAQ